MEMQGKYWTNQMDRTLVDWMELGYKNGKEGVSDDSKVLWGSLMHDDSIHWDRKFQSNSLRGETGGKFNFNVYIQSLDKWFTLD